MPTGKYIIFAWYEYNGKTYGQFLDADIPPVLEKIIAALKGFPLSDEEILTMKDSIREDGTLIRFDLSDSARTPTKKRSKVPFDFRFHFNKFTKSAKRLSRASFTPDPKSRLYLYAISANGRVVLKKKMKVGKGRRSFTQKGVKGKLSSGNYLVIAWWDYKKGKRLGKVFFVNK